LSSEKDPDGLWGPPSVLFNVYCGPSTEKSGRGVMLTTDLHLAPILRMNGAILQLTLYAIILWTGTAVLLCVGLTVNSDCVFGSTNYNIYSIW